jgi:hypothetical protein
MIYRLFLLVLACLLSGCFATPYGRFSRVSANEYNDTILDSRRAIVNYVSYRGSRDISVIDGALLRAAELTKEQGFYGFRILSDGKGSETMSMGSGGIYSSYQAGGKTVGAYNSNPIVITKAVKSITIYFVKSDEFIEGDFKAGETIKRMMPKFE